MKKLLIPLICGSLLLGACQNKEIQDYQSTSLKVDWSLDSISIHPSPVSHVTFTISNDSDMALDARNWALHFNQIGASPISKSLPVEITIDNPAGDYFVLKPMALWQKLPPGQSRKFSTKWGGIIDKKSETPKGVFAVINNEVIPVETDIVGVDINTLEPINPITPQRRYKAYERLTLLPTSDLLPFFPTPTVYNSKQGALALKNQISVSGELLTKNILATLQQRAKALNVTFQKVTSPGDLRLVRDNNIKDEGYRMAIGEEGINIAANDEHGIFYALQSLIQLMHISKLENEDKIKLSAALIEDAPRFGYRGLHLDVSRNFHSVADVKRIIDQMAFFKLNKFHFHLTDDEGWRIEIPNLPELTTIGAKRGYTVDEKNHLYPAYGSGPDPNNSYGSGYYTKEQYIDILRYAQARFVEVIPEIDVPGHARAAIKAMAVRYDRLMKEGKPEAARQYLLHDALDTSQYVSAQGYRDNVLNVCQVGTYNFMEHVLESIIAMHKEAGVELSIIHIGGDEIPHGVWEGSPVCDDFIAGQPQLHNTAESDKAADLQAYFFNKMRTLLFKHNIIMGGWEEILLAHDSDGHNTIVINKPLIHPNVLPYVWNAVWGWGREDMIYKLANAGSPVIMCNSAAYYFDMAYDSDPDEIGLSWSGFSDTKTAYGLDPLDMFKNARYDVNGQPLDPKMIDSKVRLTAEGLKNFRGIQAQLWSETIRSEDLLEYMIFPKMFGFAERAWSPAGSWMSKATREAVDMEFEKSWNRLANSIGKRGLPMIDKVFGGVNYRKPKVGVSQTGEKNIQYPGYKG